MPYLFTLSPKAVDLPLTDVMAVTSEALEVAFTTPNGPAAQTFPAMMMEMPSEVGGAEKQQYPSGVAILPEPPSLARSLALAPR